MELYLALNYLFPTNSTVDWNLQDDGFGPYIKEWKRPEPKPTVAELMAAEAVAIRDIPKNETVAQIQALEAKDMIPRVVREYLLADFRDKAVKAGMDPMLLPAYAKLKQRDDQIAALRAKL